MPRLTAPPVFALIAAAGCALAVWGAANAAEPTSYLSWPGKTGGPAAEASTAAAPAKPAPSGAVALSKQFFGPTDDMAAAPPPLMPRNVPGSQTVSNTSSINTATNRARQNELLTADSAADGPTGGASNPN